MADPYYILPVISCATLLTTIELGSDGMSTRDQPAAMKNYMRAFAVMLLPIAGSFPAVRVTSFLERHAPSCGLDVRAYPWRADILFQFII